MRLRRRVELSLLIKIALLAVLGLFSLMHFICSQAQAPTAVLTPTPTVVVYDKCEPNNRISQACRLTSSIPMRAYVWGPDNREDIYYIDAKSRDFITISLANIPCNADYDLQLFDSNLKLLSESRNYDNLPEIIVYGPSQKGRYYIRVFALKCSVIQPYVLTVIITSPSSSPTPTRGWRSWLSHIVGLLGSSLGVFISLWLTTAVGLVKKKELKHTAFFALAIATITYAGSRSAYAPFFEYGSPQEFFAAITNGFTWSTSFPLIAEALRKRQKVDN